MPQGEEELRRYGKYLLEQFNSFSNQYFQNLENVHQINKILKEQAKEFYTRYKEIKGTFLKERKILHEKQSTVEIDTKDNIEENIRLKGIYSDLLNELGYIRKKFGIKDKHLARGMYNISYYYIDPDVITVCDVLNSIKGEIDIFEGLNETDMMHLVFIILVTFK